MLYNSCWLYEKEQRETKAFSLTSSSCSRSVNTETGSAETETGADMWCLQSFYFLFHPQIYFGLLTVSERQQLQRSYTSRLCCWTSQHQTTLQQINLSNKKTRNVSSRINSLTVSTRFCFTSDWIVSVDEPWCHQTIGFRNTNMRNFPFLSVCSLIGPFWSNWAIVHLVTELQIF